MLLTDKEYLLIKKMEDEKIRIKGRLVFLLFNEYSIDPIFQDKISTISEPFELFGLFEYSSGYSKAESESGKEVTIEATIKISAVSVERINKVINEGDIIRIKKGKKTEDFYILSVTPFVPEGEYLDRVISYDCNLQRLSSRTPEKTI